MTEHALILCREPGRHSTLDKGHEEGGSAYANAGSSLRSPSGVRHGDKRVTRGPGFSHILGVIRGQSASLFLHLLKKKIIFLVCLTEFLQINTHEISL